MTSASGEAIPWLPPVPPHWKVERGRFVFRQLALRPEPDDGVVTVFRDGQVTLRENRRADGFMVALQELGYQRVRKGDLVIHGMDAFAGAIGVSDSTGKCTPEYAVLEPYRRDFSNEFFARCLRVMAWQNFIYVICPSVRERAPRFRYETFKDVLLPVPPADEQHRIAGFLDRKTAAIDALIAKKERLIELLQEKRQALITHAVTKGHDPNVPMKDSGVEWLGSVPAHWTVRMLKFVATFQRGHDLPAEQRRDGPFPVVSSGGTIGTHDIAACRGPGIVTGRYGSIGQFHLVETDFWALNTALYTKTLWGNSPRFVFYALSVLRDLFEMESKKSAVPGVDRNDLHVYSVAVPPVEEQEAIAKHLDAIVGRIDGIVRRTATSVEKLREYRQALITAAVTGKLDVSKEAA